MKCFCGEHINPDKFNIEHSGCTPMTVRGKFDDEMAFSSIKALARITKTDMTYGPRIPRSMVRGAHEIYPGYNGDGTQNWAASWLRRPPINDCDYSLVEHY